MSGFFRLRTAIVAPLATVLTVAPLWAHGQQTPPPAAPARAVTPAGESPGPQHFDGTWDYNAAQSVDAATGKPERSPDTVPRRGGSRGAPRGGFGSGSGGVDGRGGAQPVPAVGLSPLMELRDTIRDLLEVPELLTIKVTSDAVTFTDDLNRERTYPTTGKKQKYQLGTAMFDAWTIWEGPQLRKEIEASNGFKMTETYFLSADAAQLFVVIRLGEQEKNVLRAGVNRVYDRVK